MRLETEEDARRILDHFNGFHDGFIREIRLRSHDVFSQQGPEPWDVGHELTGRFDAVVDVAHYNYGEGLRPLERVVRGAFRDVKDFHLDLREVRSYEWPIRNAEIERSERAREDGTSEPCFSLRFLWSRLEGERWTERSGRLFTFGRAEFEEL